VLPSQTNFILAKPPLFPAHAWLQKLREKKILVRWFSAPEVKDYLRITIGTPAEAAALVQACGKFRPLRNPNLNRQVSWITIKITIKILGGERRVFC